MIASSTGNTNCHAMRPMTRTKISANGKSIKAVTDAEVIKSRTDSNEEQEFVKNMSDESRYYRFMDTLRELTQTSVLLTGS